MHWEILETRGSPDYNHTNVFIVSMGKYTYCERIHQAVTVCVSRISPFSPLFPSKVNQAESVYILITRLLHGNIIVNRHPTKRINKWIVYFHQSNLSTSVFPPHRMTPTFFISGSSCLNCWVKMAAAAMAADGSTINFILSQINFMVLSISASDC